MEGIQQTKWKKVIFSRSAIIKAGKNIKKEDIEKEEFDNAIKVIDNWRAAHAFPLHVIYIHLRGMAKADSSIIVAERLKRLDSILNKLKREPTMSLWMMQDLGGCRFIVKTVPEVYKYANDYEKSRKRHILVDTYDYILNPKPSGYRSLHKVYRYHSDKQPDYNNNMLIEIQFRTHLQHLWATAVETMGLFTKEAIKSGQGSEDVKRFFVLCSALLAIMEKQPIPPNVVNDVDEIVHEIEAINGQHNYLDFLSAIRVAIDNQDKINSTASLGYCILILNYNVKRLYFKFFKASQFDEANNVYNSIESTRAESKIDAVLVRVSSFKDLKTAYPNYFSDIAEFVAIIKSFLN